MSRRSLREREFFRGVKDDFSSPGWTRTTDRHFVRVLPSPLGHRTKCAYYYVEDSLLTNRFGGKELNPRLLVQGQAAYH